MGSLGRSEVTLFADQDHAIIFADVPPQEAREAQDYFLQVGARLADLLAGSGYPYCEGHIMASEEACCQSLSAWQGTFNNWLNSLDAEDLLRAKIFFDFRSALLERTLVPSLREHLRLAMANRPLFFPLLAHNILNFEPPLNTLGKIVSSDFSGGRRGFDIKGVVAQLVDVARLRALQYGVGEAGTLARLKTLASGAHLSPVTAAETIASYRLLLTVRLKHQAHCRANHLSIDNIVAPDNLPPETQLELKQALHQLKALKDNLQHEFGNRP
jgi:CBS domain-containing protein